MVELINYNLKNCLGEKIFKKKIEKLFFNK